MNSERSFMEITSRSNPKVKQVARLLSHKQERDKTKSFVAEGARLCEETVLSGLRPTEVYLTKEAAERYPKQAALLCSAAETVFFITPEISAKLSDTLSPQGLFAVCAQGNHMEHRIAIAKGGRYLLLDTVQNPSNVGAILRTAEAFGINGVWLHRSADIYSPKVLRGAMGGVFRLPIVLTAAISSVLCTLQAGGVSVWGAALTAQSVPVSRALFAEGGAIVIGNEGAGLSGERLQQCDGSVVIPMQGGAESLNAAVAASILLWEMTQGGEER